MRDTTITIAVTTEQPTYGVKVQYANAMRPHRNKPYLIDYLREFGGVDLRGSGGAEGSGKPVSISTELLRRHAVLVGSSGGGKTTLMLHMLREQLRAGCSAVVIDIKDTTIWEAVACAEEAGMRPSQITVATPTESAGIPAFNVLGMVPGDVRRSATQFTELLAAFSDSGFQKAQLYLLHAARIVASQGLCLGELYEFLTNRHYRASLMDRARQTGSWERFEDEHRAFAQFMASSGNTFDAKVEPAVWRLQGLITDEFVKALIDTPEDTIKLDRFWHEPRLLAIHIDRATIGDNATQVLSGIFVDHVFKTAMRTKGSTVPVVLFLDELKVVERTNRDNLEDILAQARSKNVRLIGGCQGLDQVSPAFRTGLRRAALAVYYRLDPEAAAEAGKALSTGEESSIVRATVDVAKPNRTEGPETEKKTYTLVSILGDELTFHPAEWPAFDALQQRRDPDLTTDGIVAYFKAQRVSQVYCKDRKTGAMYPIDDVVDRLTAEECRFSGPSPVKLTVTFPRPKVTDTDRITESQKAAALTRTLQELPPQRVVVVIDGGRKVHATTTNAFPWKFSLKNRPTAYLSSRSLYQAERERSARQDTVYQRSVPPAPKEAAPKAAPNVENVRTPPGPSPKPARTPTYNAPPVTVEDDGSL